MPFSVLLQGHDLGVDFEDMWAEAIGFLTGTLLGQLILVMGGLFLAFIAAALIVRLVTNRL